MRRNTRRLYRVREFSASKTDPSVRIGAGITSATLRRGVGDKGTADGAGFHVLGGLVRCLLPARPYMPPWLPTAHIPIAPGNKFKPIPNDRDNHDQDQYLTHAK